MGARTMLATIRPPMIISSRKTTPPPVRSAKRTAYDAMSRTCPPRGVDTGAVTASTMEVVPERGVQQEQRHERIRRVDHRSDGDALEHAGESRDGEAVEGRQVPEDSAPAPLLEVADARGDEERGADA